MSSSLRFRSQIIAVFVLCTGFGLPSLSATIGAYTGSFDPVTRGHEAIIRAAANEPGLDHLIVFVNVSGEKNFITSGQERIALLKAGLADLGEKVEFRTILQETKNEQLDEIAATNELVSFIGDDSFAKLPESARARPHVHWVVYDRELKGQIAPGPNVELRATPPGPIGLSSTQARQDIMKPEISNILSPPVLRIIREQHFYEPVEGQAQLEVKRRDFLIEFALFESHLATLFPQYKMANLRMPEFKPTQSRQGWLESLLREVLKQVPEAEKRKFWESAEPSLVRNQGNMPSSLAQIARFKAHVDPLRCEAVFIGW